MPRTDRRHRWPNRGPVGLLGAALWLGAALTSAACRKSIPAGAGGAGPTSALPGSAATPNLPNPTVLLDAGSRKVPFRVEVAATEAERERAMTHPKILTRPTGMLFVFPNDAPQTVSMKNTVVALDAIFIGSDRRVVGIVENASLKTEAPLRVDGMSRYVLEIAGGLSSKLGVKPGSEVEFKGISSVFPDSGGGQPH